MLISKAFFHREKHAFHLYLYVHETGDNTLMSTIPSDLLNKMFPNFVATIRFAYIPSIQSGGKLLQELAEKVFSKTEFREYFYPDYLLKDGLASTELAEQIIKFQEMIPLFPSSYYTQKTDSVKFFILNQKYLRKQRHIIRTAKYINKDYFEYNYIFNREMAKEFEQLYQKNTLYIELVEDSEVEYVLLLNAKEERLMFVYV